MKAAVVAALLILGTQAWMSDVWAVTIYTDRAAFEQQGTIDIQYGFEDFPAGQDVYPILESATETTRAHWTSHGITYDAPYTGSVNDQRLYGGYPYSTIAGRIDPESQYSMFGFDLANIPFFPDFRADFDITIGTNLSPYWTGALDNPAQFNPNQTYLQYSGDAAWGDIGFLGFVAGPGEYFTDFFISIGGGQKQIGDPSIDNIALGHTSKAVPEPHSLVLMIVGLLGLWWWRGIAKKPASISAGTAELIQ